MDLPAYEARLEDECRRKNIQFPRTCNKLCGVVLGQASATYHDVDLEDPRRARYMSEQILKDKLQDIAKKPMNDVSPNLKTSDYMTACSERIDVRAAGEILRTPDIRKRMYTSLLNQLPGKVSEYTKDAFTKKWDPVDFEWGDLIQIVVDISVERQTRASTTMIIKIVAKTRSQAEMTDNSKAVDATKAEDATEAEGATEAVGVSTVVDVRRVADTTEFVDEARKATTVCVNDMEVVDAQASAIKARTVEAITPATEAVPKTPRLVGPEMTKARSLEHLRRKQSIATRDIKIRARSETRVRTV
ncbi:hypothetical protein B5M09_009591 [Aphanomyces astaci]|uniref:Uncharacterized protein n=1 Tax=Aphanomyces astaci TaxID=112090 RepID=A0A3R7WIK0_APHAT|nr:hypothetical protein B5M09_009591 [Aphanomyces astaci]